MVCGLKANKEKKKIENCSSAKEEERESVREKERTSEKVYNRDSFYCDTYRRIKIAKAKKR